jgi:hypothetical protein
MIVSCINEEQIKGKSWSEKRRQKFPKSKQEDLIVNTLIALAAGIEMEEPQGLRKYGKLNRNSDQHNPIVSKSCFLSENNHSVSEQHGSCLKSTLLEDKGADEQSCRGTFSDDIIW